MYFGYQTIIFGEQIDDIDETLGVIERAGFQGVEFCQQPNMILARRPQGPPTPVSPAELVMLLAKHRLHLLGFADGTLDQRIDFCNAMWKETEGQNIADAFRKPLYLYMDDPTVESVNRCLNAGYFVAIHPHVHMPVEDIDDALALPYLSQHGLFIMPDTAHQFIRSGDALSKIQKIPHGKLIAVHIKDWSSAYGRSSLRYAKGFVPLGEGEVHPEAVLAWLHNLGYNGWVIAEQDYCRHNPACAVAQTAQWLRDRGYMPEPLVPSATAPLDCSSCLICALPSARANNPDLSNVMLQAASKSLFACYQTLVQDLCRSQNAIHVSLWACNPARNDISLLCDYPPDQDHVRAPIIDKRRSYIGIAAETGKVLIDRIDDIPSKFPGRMLFFEQHARNSGADIACAIPVSMQYNPHHTRFLVGMLLKSEPADPESLPAMIRGPLNQAADIALADDCSFAAGKVNGIADQTETVADFLNKLTELIKQTIRCEGLSIFLADASQDMLTLACTTGIEWDASLPANGRHYTRQSRSHSTVQSWLQNKTILKADAFIKTANGTEARPRSREVGPDVDPANDNIMISPIVGLSMREGQIPAMRVLGIIRCRNKRQPAGTPKGTVRKLFTDDDIAVLDAICQTATPHLELRQIHEQRLHAVARMSHELKNPVNSLRGELDLLQLQLQRAAPGVLRDAKINRFENMFDLTDVAVRVVNNATLFGFSSNPRPLKIERCYLMGDIVAPTKSQVRYLVHAHGFDLEGIRYSDFEEIPRLFIDKNQFQQVFFNLFSNAIKYSLPEPREFNVFVDARHDVARRCFVIDCIDHGVGIAKNFSNYIFGEGVRGPFEQAGHVEGLGIGLFVVRQVVEAHGGRVFVSSFYNPTTITIELPDNLRDGPPTKAKGKTGGAV